MPCSRVGALTGRPECSRKKAVLCAVGRRCLQSFAPARREPNRHCHPERSEGSLAWPPHGAQKRILRYARDGTLLDALPELVEGCPPKSGNERRWGDRNSDCPHSAGPSPQPLSRRERGFEDICLGKDRTLAGFPGPGARCLGGPRRWAGTRTPARADVPPHRPAAAYPSAARALRNMRSHGDASGQPVGDQLKLALRSVRSGCGIRIVARPSSLHRPAIASADPLGLAG